MTILICIKIPKFTSISIRYNHPRVMPLRNRTSQRERLSFVENAHRRINQTGMSLLWTSTVHLRDISPHDDFPFRYRMIHADVFVDDMLLVRGWPGMGRFTPDPTGWWMVVANGPSGWETYPLYMTDWPTTPHKNR